MQLSQNFIKDPYTVRELLSASSIGPNDLVLEIGPGRGIITKELAYRAREVVAIEKHLELYHYLVEKFEGTKNLKIYNKDFLNWNLPDKPYKVFSNIPFSITAEIIDKFLKSKNRPTEMYFILQTEAAEKYEGDKMETQSSILAKIFYDVQVLGNIDRSAFTPKPQVKISLIKFILKPDTQIDSKIYQSFRDFVIFGFNQWKGNIFDAYKKVFSFNQFKTINKNLKINNLKPSQLNLNQWLDFFDSYQKFAPEDKKNFVDGFEIKYLKRIRVKK